ncbi:hypothetical protein [Alkalilacustris brevis]|uniref:hypothetical protein n=1 Tax=Alkalilacustris brevis TaxID=2026338 RepID=UPI000E0DD092|nr:hypothetical protein [Alkalilacustris brevis]
MARLILHVGTHKTGTTTIQDTLFHNRAQLSRRGVIYPRIGLSRGQHGLVCVWNQLPFPFAIEDPAAAWDRLVRRWAGTDATVFVSSEEFSRALPENRRVDMAELRARLRPFDEVRLVCTLRRQPDFLQSIYQQISRDRPGPPLEPFLTQARKSAVASGLWLDYRHLYQHFLCGFAPEEIVLISYEGAKRAPGGVLGACLAVIDPALAPEELEALDRGDSNVSPNPLAQFMANTLAAPGSASDWAIGIAEDILREHFGTDRPMTLFTTAEMRAFRARFGPANRALEKAVAPYQPGFALERISPAREAVSRQDITAAVWRRYARAIWRARHAAVA